MSPIFDNPGAKPVNRVKQYRRAKGLSQQALAHAVGVSRQTVNMVENQGYNPSLSLCIRLAQVLDADLNALFWPDNGDTPDAKAN